MPALASATVTRAPAPGELERDEAGAAAGVEHPRAHSIAERR